jgi:phosphate-selective porin OprO and OprP
LQIAGYAHFRYQQLEEKGKIDGFDIRRAYLDFKGTITPYWSYRLQLDFAGSPKIVDIYTDLKINDWANFTIGQQVLPISLNNTTSNTKLELADRSQVVEALTLRKGDVLGDNNGRDIGVSFYGSLIPLNNLNLIEYRIGVFNGSGINKTDYNEAKDIVGRVILHPIKGLDLGGSYYTGWSPDSAVIYKTASKDNIAANQLGGTRQRIGAEVSYTYSIFNIKGEYLVGKDNKVSKSGYYCQLSAFVLKDKLQLVGRYDSYDKNTDKDNNISTNITAGVNFFATSNVLLQAAYTFKQEEDKDKPVVNNFGSLQLQISF